MANALNITRPKADLTVPLTVETVDGTVAEDGSTTYSTYFLPILLQDIDPASFTVASCVLNETTTVTTVNNGFIDVKEGDVVSGTGIPVGATVATKTNNNTIILSEAATASSTVTLTFDPPSIDPTLYGIQLHCSVSGNVMSIRTTGYKYDGHLGDQAGTINNASAFKVLGRDTIDLDVFLSQARIARTNGS
jgi:hypothetical protein